MNQVPEYHTENPKPQCLGKKWLIEKKTILIITIARRKDTTYQNKYIYIRKYKACFGHTLISYCYVHSYFEHCFKISFMLKRRFVKIVLNDILMCVKP